MYDGGTQSRRCSLKADRQQRLLWVCREGSPGLCPEITKAVQLAKLVVQRQATDTSLRTESAHLPPVGTVGDGRGDGCGRQEVGGGGGERVGRAGVRATQFSVKALSKSKDPRCYL